MRRSWFLYLYLITILFSPAPISQASYAPLNETTTEADQRAAAIAIPAFVRPPGPSIEADGPSALAIARNGAMFIADTRNEQIIVVNPRGQLAPALVLPEGVGATDLLVACDVLYVLDARNERLLALDFLGRLLESQPVALSENGVMIETLIDRQVDSSQVPDRSVAGASQVTCAPHSYVTRDSDQQAQVIIGAQSAAARTRIIQTQHFLGSATYLSSDEAGNDYILVEEVYEDVPIILVDTTVWRFSSAGQLTGMARVPIDQVDFVPHRFVAVNRQGLPHFLQVAGGQASLAPLTFASRIASNLDDRWSRIADLLVTPAPGQAPAVPAGITRPQIIRNADAYLHVNWVLGSANYHSGPSVDWSGCTSTEHWRLPRYLAGRLNQTIAEAPYAWGGYQSVDEFRARINRGDWAGDICSEAKLSNVAGVDCSGYLSKVLGVGHYDVNGLKTIGHQINWNDMLPGDYMTYSSTHVILFDTFVNGSNASGGVRVYESTMTNAYDRVVYNQRSYSGINGYTAWRYNNVVEQPRTIPPNQELMLNGSFDTYSLQSWWSWGDIAYAFYDSTMLYFKHNAGGNGGSVGQSFQYDVPVNTPFELRLKLANTSSVTKTPLVSIVSANNWDVQCRFTLGPGENSLREYIVRGVNHSFWGQFNIQVSPDPIDGLPDLVMDDVSLKVLPDAAITQTECLAPNARDTTPPGGNITYPIDGVVITNRSIGLAADAWDNAGGSGVQKVVFWAYYQDNWHAIGEDYSAPYTYQWAVPVIIPVQAVFVSTHVFDWAGNETIDPGGYRYFINLPLSPKAFIPFATR